jgi:hypothetical protein
LCRERAAVCALAEILGLLRSPFATQGRSQGTAPGLRDARINAGFGAAKGRKAAPAISAVAEDPGGKRSNDHSAAVAAIRLPAWALCNLIATNFEVGV